MLQVWKIMREQLLLYLKGKDGFAQNLKRSPQVGEERQDKQKGAQRAPYKLS